MSNKDYQNKLQKALIFINSEHANSRSIYWKKQNNNKLIKDAIFTVYKTSPKRTIKKLIDEQGDKFLGLVASDMKETIQNLEINNDDDDENISTKKLWLWLSSTGKKELRKTRTLSAMMKVVQPFCSSMSEENQSEVISLEKELRQLTMRAGMVRSIPTIHDGHHDIEVKDTYEVEPVVEEPVVSSSLSSLSSISSSDESMIRNEKAEVIDDETLSVDMSKDMIGEILYVLICRFLTKSKINNNLYKQPDLAGKITGMLLELENSELIPLMKSPDDPLPLKITEAIEVLKLYHESLFILETLCFVSSNKLLGTFESLTCTMVPPLEIVTTTYNSGSSLEEAHTQVSVEIKPARLLIPLHWIEQPQHQLQPNENDQSKNINNNISIIKQMIKAISVVAIPIDNMRFRYSDFMGIRGTEVNALLSSIEDKCKQKLDNDIELTAAVHVFNTWRSGYVVVGVWITDKRIAHSQLQIPEDLYSHTTFDSLANLIEPQVQQAITSATTPLYTRPVRTYSPPGRSSYGRSSYGRPIRPTSRPMLSTPYGSIIRHRREHYGGRLIESSDYYEEECLSRNQTGKSSHTGKSYSEDQSKKHIKKDISKDGLYRKALGKTRSKNMKNARLTRTWE